MSDWHHIYRTLERTIAGIERSAEFTATLSGALEAIVHGAGPLLGITGGRLYRHDPRRRAWVLEAAVGDSGPAHPGFAIPEDYPPLRRLVEEGFLLMEEGDPDFDPRIEQKVGVRRFAAITCGDKAGHLIAFTLEPGIDPQKAVYLLVTLRHLINLRLLQGPVLRDIAEAREIQLSLLPRTPPRYLDFDIAGRSVPAEQVGGDLYDFLLLGDRNLGLAVMDSCGHGLPAALLARDAITGLRVVLDIQIRMSHAIERVNRVISRSALASRFISLFYAEFEPSGNLVYCNAGHPPALLWRAGRITRLRRGGMVLGPDPDATFDRGFETFPRGAVLLVYTDGITEALSPRTRRPFGPGRIERILREYHHLPAAGIVERLFHDLEEFSPGPRADDQTVVVVRRP